MVYSLQHQCSDSFIHQATPDSAARLTSEVSSLPDPELARTDQEQSDIEKTLKRICLGRQKTTVLTNARKKILAFLCYDFGLDVAEKTTAGSMYDMLVEQVQKAYFSNAMPLCLHFPGPVR
jgi:hypothetical protein